MYFNNDDALYVLEQFIDSEYFPSELVLNKINYKTDEDKYAHTVMCYFDVNDEVYNNYNKYERSMVTSFANFLRNTEDLPREITLEKFGTSTINGENAIVIEIVDEYMVFEGIGWDPSMSKDPSAPFNQEEFLDTYSKVLGEFEHTLDFTPEQIERLYDENLEKFENDLITVYDNLYNKLYVKGITYNPALGDEAQEMTPIYHEIYNRIKDKYFPDLSRDFKRELKDELFRNLLNTYPQEFSEVYNSNMPMHENNIQPVQAGEVVKLQKPQNDTFTDIVTNNDGVEMGNCSVCSAENVVVGDHICKTIVNPKAYESLDINKINDKLYNFLKNKYKELYSININDSNIFVMLYKTYFDEYDSLSLLNRYKDIKKDVINFMINNNNNNYNENSIIINNIGVYEMVTTIEAFKEMLSIKTTNNVINEQDKNQPDNSKEAEYRSSNLLNTYKDEIIQDVKEMFPDYKNEELEDAASYGVDYIFNLVGNTIEEYEWKYIEPVLLEKLKVLLVNV